MKRGALRRPIRGVYAAAQCPDDQAFRAQALSLVVPKGCVVTDWTATWVWTGMHHPEVLAGTPPISVFRFRGHDRLRNALTRSGERWFQPDDVVPLTGDLLISTPKRTAWDIGRFSRPLVAIGGMDALARLGAFSHAELLQEVERFRGQRGVVQLRHLAPLVDAGSESFGESALRLRWHDTPSAPAPTCQIPIRDPLGTVLYRLDLGIEELATAGEYDGDEHHSTEEQRAHDVTRRAIITEEYGWNVLVFRREDVFGQHETVTQRLGEALSDARRTSDPRAWARG